MTEIFGPSAACDNVGDNTLSEIFVTMHHIGIEHLEPLTARFTRCLGVQDALFLSPPHITLTLPKP